MRTPCRRAALLLLLIANTATTAELSHKPMRPGPVLAGRALGESTPHFFVDAQRGEDEAAGSVEAPWKTLARGVRDLKPGETLVLRGGTYYEHVWLGRSGEPERPIVIRSYPGETAVIDGGLREFVDDPAGSWQPAREAGIVDAAADEYVSTRTYPHAARRRSPMQFLPDSWEPMWGIEEERPMVLGHFADSMVPLHGYRIVADLRATSELFPDNKKSTTGMYGGPGLWLNRDTGRIHCRLAHTKLAGLGDDNYRGPTDPRKVPLVVAAGFGDEVLGLVGLKHVRLEDLVVRGGTGSAMLNLYGCDGITLDDVTVYGGNPALLINACANVRVVDSAFRGLAAPWTSRAHMKYRGTASYQIVLQNNQPRNTNIEFDHCEFTDDHDFAFIRYANDLRVHHSFIDNFNDDGFEIGPKLRDHTLHIYQNRIGRILIPLTQHEIEKDESPLDHDAGHGVFVYRNVFDSRGGTYKSPPRSEAEAADPATYPLRDEGNFVGDHGGPIWPVMCVYQNTFVRNRPVFRDYFLMGFGAQGLKQNERDVFNNIFVQQQGTPGAGFAGIKEPGKLREAGNLVWGYGPAPAPAAPKQAPKQKANKKPEKPKPPGPTDPFTKFRASPMFAASKMHYPPGFTTNDLHADPKFAKPPTGKTGAAGGEDLTLQTGSPAIDAGQQLPSEWRDPLADKDRGTRDLGAVPHGAKPEGVGIGGRLGLFGG
jgi:hypothetical protein